LPIFHAAAAPSTHVGALAGGEVIYMMRRFDLQLFLRTVEKYGANEMPVVPPIVLAIVKSPYSRTRPFLKSVRSCSCGAAPLDKGLQARLSEMFEEAVTCNQVWGMTETSCIATMFPFDEKDDTGSVGRLLPNLEAKYVVSSILDSPHSVY
jgi:acyl-CoA synthetase (AMP-forming)/AMP-acid ligase II